MTPQNDLGRPKLMRTNDFRPKPPEMVSKWPKYAILGHIEKWTKQKENLSTPPWY